METTSPPPPVLKSSLKIYLGLAQGFSNFNIHSVHAWVLLKMQVLIRLTWS